MKIYLKTLEYDFKESYQKKKRICQDIQTTLLLFTQKNCIIKLIYTIDYFNILLNMNVLTRI